jgi:hypothetical protein
MRLLSHANPAAAVQGANSRATRPDQRPQSSRRGPPRLRKPSHQGHHPDRYERAIQASKEPVTQQRTRRRCLCYSSALHTVPIRSRHMVTWRTFRDRVAKPATRRHHRTQLSAATQQLNRRRSPYQASRSESCRLDTYSADAATPVPFHGYRSIQWQDQLSEQSGTRDRLPRLRAAAPSSLSDSPFAAQHRASLPSRRP